MPKLKTKSGKTKKYGYGPKGMAAYNKAKKKQGKSSGKRR